MTEPSYADREQRAKLTATSAEERFLHECKTLGINPDSITGSPLLAIAEARQRAERDRLRLLELPGFRF